MGIIVLALLVPMKPFQPSPIIQPFAQQGSFYFYI